MKYYSNIYANIKFKCEMNLQKYREPFNIERFYNYSVILICIIYILNYIIIYIYIYICDDVMNVIYYRLK